MQVQIHIFIHKFLAILDFYSVDEYNFAIIYTTRGAINMKLNDKVQMIITVVIFIAFYIVTMVTDQRIFRNIGLMICGLLYVIHPVVSEKDADNKSLKKYVRVAGVVLVLAGLFTP